MPVIGDITSVPELIVVAGLIALPIVLLVSRRIRKRYGTWLFIAWLALLAWWLFVSNPELITCVRSGFNTC